MARFATAICIWKRLTAKVSTVWGQALIDLAPVDLPPFDLPPDGKLVQNITHFARSLRKAGLPLGTGRVLEAVRAVQAAGLTRRDDFYWTLHACFVSRPEQRLLFDQMFRLYWRDPKYLDHMMALITPMVRGLQDDRRANPPEKRAAEALLDGAERPVLAAGAMRRIGPAARGSVPA